ncbi:MAG: SGNH/GDSL hydrolase family protein [Pseudonocardiaceae bacterium]
MLGHRRGVAIALAVLCILLGVASTATTQVTAAAQQANTPAPDLSGVAHYVALGDSFAAGPFILPQRTDPIGCARSTRNYPALVAQDLRVAEFTDVSCSRAVTGNMTAAQAVPLGSNPPQFDALRRDTDLVTVSIGGNDMGFADIVTTCGLMSVTDPLGAPCKRQATAGGSDVYAERIIAVAPKIAGVLQGIRERSPNARVLLVSYLRLLPPAIGCWPIVPIARGDVPYLDGLHQQLNAVLAEQAGTHGAVFVDAYAASLGHDMCQAPSVKWVEGFIPTRTAFPIHPNAQGMRAVADLTLSTLSSSAR